MVWEGFLTVVVDTNANVVSCHGSAISADKIPKLISKKGYLPTVTLEKSKEILWDELQHRLESDSMVENMVLKKPDESNLLVWYRPPNTRRDHTQDNSNEEIHLAYHLIGSYSPSSSTSHNQGLYARKFAFEAFGMIK